MSEQDSLPCGPIVSLLVLLICALAADYVWNYVGSYSLDGHSIPLYPYRPYVSIFAIGAFIGLGGLLFSLAIDSKKRRQIVAQTLKQFPQAKKFMEEWKKNINEIV